MVKTFPNPCYRCGTERIFLKKWKEEVTTFTGKIQMVTFLQTVCPHQDCQKLVDIELKAAEAKRTEIRLKREENLLIKKTALLETKKNRKQELPINI